MAASGSLLHSLGDQTSHNSMNDLFEWEKTNFEASGAAPRAAEVALAVGAASVGGALAAAALGHLVVLREGGGARLPWESKGSRKQQGLTPAEWRGAFDPSSGRLRAGGLKAIGRVRVGGCSNAVRGEVWPFLLGLHDANSTAAEREAEQVRRREWYEDLRAMARVITAKAQAEEVVKAKVEELERESMRLAKEKKEVRQKRGEGTDDSLEEVGLLAERKAEDEVAGDDELFCDAVEVSGMDSLASSTESFIDVAREEASHSSVRQGTSSREVDSSSSPTSQSRLDDTTASSASFQTRQEEAEVDPGITADGMELLPQDSPSCSQLGGQEGDEVVKSSFVDVGGVGTAGLPEEDVDWEELGSSIPAQFRKKAEEGRQGALEGFLVWRRIMRLDAVRMNAQWVPFSTQGHFPEAESLEAAERAELSNHEHLSAAQRTHAARLVSILEAYAVQDPEIGYCQGMTDLLSPFVALLEGDADAFWCFARFMETARENFRTDEVGIRKQLDLVSRILEVCDPELFRHLSCLGAQDCIFVYRMVIVLLRRELSFEQTMVLWEVLWAEAAAAAAADSAAAAAASVGAYMSSREGPRPTTSPRADFFLFVIAAIVVSRRRYVLQCEGMDEILRLCNSLAGELDVWDLIDRARTLVGFFSFFETTEHGVNAQGG